MKYLHGVAGKIIIPVVILTFLLVLSILTVSSLALRREMKSSFDREIAMAAHNVEIEMERMSGTLINQLNQLAYDPQLIQAVQSNDREAIFKVINQWQVPHKADFFTVIDLQKKALVRSGNFNKYGDSVEAWTETREAFDGKSPRAFFASTENNPLALRGAVAIRDTSGKIIGALSGGYQLNTLAWVDGMKEIFNMDFTTFLGETRVATTLKKENGERAIGTQLNNPPLKKILFDEKKNMFGETMVLGKPMRVFYHPLLGSDGNTIGIVFAGITIAKLQSAIWSNIYTNLIITGIGLVLFCGLLILVVRNIVGPLQKVTNSANELVQGHLDVDLTVNTKDELSVLANAFNRVGEALRQKVEVARFIAQKNLMTWVPLTSQDDALGTALIEMRQALYEAMRDMAGNSKRMHSESDTLSGSLQVLVSGSAKSSEAISNIEASIKNLNEQTRDNAKHSSEAASLATQARSGSTHGRERMMEMIRSMEQITQGASEIKKIIRVIDDIAFQTNLLALNAAVEAARAGVHGKGFAVVAEEVRNLASRSAKAAQETNHLIEEAIGQVQQGSQVAQTTSDSLNTIIEQVEHISDIINKINQESEKQRQEVGLITSAISQASVAAESNSQQIVDASHSVESIVSTAKELDDFTKLFKYREDGKVLPPQEEAVNLCCDVG